MHDQHTRCPAGLRQRRVDLIDHRLIEGVVFAGSVQTEQKDVAPVLAADQIRPVGCRATLRRGGHWSKSTVTVSVIG
jgi:hypothetical protein